MKKLLALLVGRDAERWGSAVKASGAKIED